MDKWVSPVVGVCHLDAGVGCCRNTTRILMEYNGDTIGMQIIEMTR